MTEVKTAKHQMNPGPSILRSLVSNLGDAYPEKFRGDPRKAGEIGLSALSSAAFALAGGELSLTKRYYAMALDAVSAGARAMAAGRGVMISYKIDGKGYKGAANGPSKLALPSEYLRALSFAIALRRTKVADDLMTVPLKEIKQAAREVTPAYVPYVEAWRSFWQKAPDTPKLLEKAAELFEPSALELTDPKEAAADAANIPLMQALLEMDEKKFNAALVRALKAHKAWWGTGPNRVDPQAVIAHQSAALASLALQRGIKLTVTSGYLPPWLIEGRDPEGSADPDFHRDVFDE